LPGDTFQFKCKNVAIKMELVRDAMNGLSFLLIARGTVECHAIKATTTRKNTAKVTIPFILT